VSQQEDDKPAEGRRRYMRVTGDTVFGWVSLLVSAYFFLTDGMTIWTVGAASAAALVAVSHATRGPEVPDGIDSLERGWAVSIYVSVVFIASTAAGALTVFRKPDAAIYPLFLLYAMALTMLSRALIALVRHRFQRGSEQT